LGDTENRGADRSQFAQETLPEPIISVAKKN
jgi:hypothetical protein